ncbi:NAD(P)H-hydrate dehydratase [Acidiferrobacter sp.]|uniref:NAD(P)H-hydrate dehydratase n=1 Tax=Acidiferrobacter sp. TaxID=1872107 RepID=UPI00261B47A1|nr:NAD(P)H-hydrate dehydratase [Acidiferrobacter sp.]
MRAIDGRMAAGVMRFVTYRFPGLCRLGLLIGAGGNGRQAMALAGRYRETGIQVTLVRPGDTIDAEGLRACDVLIDGLIGTGLHGPLSAPYREQIGRAHASGRPIVALDAPTGLDLGTGHGQPGAMRADYTLFCGGAKIGALTGAGRALCGTTATIDVGRPYPAGYLRALVPGDRDLCALLAPRPATMHKGDAGTLVVVGGGMGMPGAVRLAALAAYRAGTGLVVAGVHEDNAGVLAAAFPECMAFGVSSPALPWGRAQALLVGPGLGRGDWARDAWQQARGLGQAMVVDGDGLYWLAHAPESRKDWVLTPHEGEAARLLGVTRAEVAADRPRAAVELQRRYGGVCVLKGAGTLVAGGDILWLCPFGNPGMATAGMGDVLAGTIAGLMAQGLSGLSAARLGTFVHARAGDLAVAGGPPRGLLASDVASELRAVLGGLC